MKLQRLSKYSRDIAKQAKRLESLVADFAKVAQRGESPLTDADCALLRSEMVALSTQLSVLTSRLGGPIQPLPWWQGDASDVLAADTEPKPERPGLFRPKRSDDDYEIPF